MFVGVGQGAEEDSVCKAEDGGGRANADGEGGQCGYGEGGGAAEASPGVLEVLAEVIEPEGDADGADVFGDLGLVAESAFGGAAGGFRGHAVGPVEVSPHLEVGFEFFAELVFGFHANLRRRLTPRVVSAHCSRARARRLRPAGVSW